MAAIAAYMVTRESRCKVRGVYTFGAPAVGDDVFVKEYNTLLEECTFRYTLSHDIVPNSNWRFAHVGRHLVLNYDGNSVIENHLLTSYAEKVMETFDLDTELMSE